MKKLFLLLSISIPFFTFSQITFEKTYSGGSFLDWGECVQQTSDNGYIIAGSCTDGYSNGFLIKTDEYGDTVWTKKYSSENGSIHFNSVIMTNDGGYLITGDRDNYPSGMRAKICLFKTNSIGDTLWTKDYGGEDGDYGHEVIQTDDGGYIIVGVANENSGGETVPFLIKTDENGDTLWTKMYEGNDFNSGGNSIAETTDGGYIFTGGYSSYDDSSDSFVIKTDKDGDTLWTKTYNLGYSEEALSIHELNEGGFLVSGNVNYTYEGESDIFLMQIDSNGDTLWTKRYGGEKIEFGGKSILTVDGGYVITGTFWDYSLGMEILLIKTDENGAESWSRLFDGSHGNCVQQTSDVGFIITARKYIEQNDSEVYLIKTNENGIVSWEEEIFTLNENMTISRPNPFSTSTTIEYLLTQPQTVTITFFNQFGNQVDRLEQKQSAGKQQVEWTPELPGGIYYFRLKAGEHMMSGKLVLVK